jgi:hypothetical protein
MKKQFYAMHAKASKPTNMGILICSTTKKGAIVAWNDYNQLPCNDTQEYKKDFKISKVWVKDGL